MVIQFVSKKKFDDPYSYPTRNLIITHFTVKLKTTVHYDIICCLTYSRVIKNGQCFKQQVNKTRVVIQIVHLKFVLS